MYDKTRLADNDLPQVTEVATFKLIVSGSDRWVRIDGAVLLWGPAGMGKRRTVDPPGKEIKNEHICSKMTHFHP